MWYARRMEYYLAIERNVLIYATTYISLENIMIREEEASQPQKTTFSDFTHMKCAEQTESGPVAAPSWRSTGWFRNNTVFLLEAAKML